MIEAISFAFDGGSNLDTSTVTIRDERDEHQIACGNGVWHKGSTTFTPFNSQQIAASGAWTDEDTYTVKLCFYETPFRPTLICRFTEDQLTLDVKANVGFGPTEWPQLVGKLA